MKAIGRVLFWAFILGIGVPVAFSLLGLILSSFTDYKNYTSTSTTIDVSLEGKPFSTSPPRDLVDALSILSNLTDVQRDDIKESYRGKLVRWRIPVSNVSRRKDEYVIQTSSIGNITASCKVTPLNDGQVYALKRIKAGDFISCKGIIAGYPLGIVNLSPAMLID